MALNSASKWYKKILGDKILECQKAPNDNFKIEGENLVSVDVIFDSFSKLHDETIGKLVIGLYFTPLDGTPDESTNYLVQLYRLTNYRNESVSSKSLQENNHQMAKPKTFLEVIHVFFTNSEPRRLIDKDKIWDRLKDYPWFMVPFWDHERIIRLMRKYQIRSQTPSFILLNSKNGKIITKHGRDRLLEDPSGLNFPWTPRPLHVVMQNIELQSSEENDASGKVITFENLKGLIIGFYFSAHWCPPCKGFTPQLIETYKILKNTGANFEVIFVSSDRSLESQKAYFKTMPWLAVPYSEQEVRAELASLFGVQGIPTLIIVDADGSVITSEGRGEINDDPTGQMFPWRPRPIKVLTERHLTKLQDSPGVVLFVEGDELEMEFAEAVLSPIVKELEEMYRNEEVPLQFFIACDSDTSDNLREFIGIDDVVPLLTLINIPENTWATLEERIDVSEESVKEFVHRFLKNDLQMQLIESNKVSCCRNT